jgi:A/G-specific adenine glycosylase
MARQKHQPIQPPGKEWIRSLQNHLLGWYDEVKRDLPWRKDQDPYKIWVSEIMLQQTRVDTVIPYYLRFMEKFPTVKDLAEADEDDVIKAWEGLGYYSRARNLQAAAKEVCERHGGVVPRDLASISRLKGIGPYTAGAILSIAYNLRVPAVDGNVMRVMSRWFVLKEDVTKVSTRRLLEELDLALIPEDRPGDFNQALMELGALVCTPIHPACDSCPVRQECKARALGIQHELPVKKKAKPPAPVPMVVGWIRNHGRVLLERRPEEGLLAGMWGLPSLEREGVEDPVGMLTNRLSSLGIRIVSETLLGEVEHVFSHRRWQVTVIEGEAISTESSLSDAFRWVKEDELEGYAFPKVYHKAMQLAQQKTEKEAAVQGRLF